VEGELGNEVLPTHTASKPNRLVCPACGSRELRPLGQYLANCESCGILGRTILETLQQLVALPDVTGKHPCECGHPEMRLLPDGVFHCPACRSEVVPPERAAALPSSLKRVE
jgi:ribosomal protein L37AE/L43A